MKAQYAIRKTLDPGVRKASDGRTAKKFARTVHGWMPECEQVQKARFFSTNPGSDAALVQSWYLRYFCGNR